MESSKKIVCIVLVCLFVGIAGVRNASGKFLFFDEQTEEEKAQQAEMLRDKREAAERAKREAAEEKARAKRAKEEANIAALDLPEDNTTRFTARELRISGNTLIPTDELLEEIPSVYNASDKPVTEAESVYLFDLRAVKDVLLEPGQPHQVSARTIQGLTQYFLSLYQQQHYAGIYVYVPTEAVSGNKLQNDVLQIEVLEAEVSSVAIRSYEPNQVEVEEGYLRKTAVMDWSPIKEGEVANQKALDDFVNLLNLNPDRYVSAVVTKGATPRSLSVEYDIYEANPWHFFVQVDNAGTKDRQWVPRIGVINTNLLGIDDTFTAIYQAPWDKDILDEYSIYGSYDFPLIGPKLRLNAYGGYSQFNVSPEGGVTNFIGNGDFYGGVLRYNALQTEPDTLLLGDGWFFDIKGMLEHTRSKVKPTVWPYSVLAADVRFWLWGAGLELHRSDDMTRSSVGFDRWESWGGESDAVDFANARTGAKSDFSIYSFNANHSQYMDPNKVGRVSSTFRWIGSNERLVPAKMTSFGGMYTVRGYDEYEILADGGILGSFQYEFDIVKYQETLAAQQQQETEKKPFVRKLAPLGFLDYGRTTVNHPVATEKRHEELMSVGGGMLLELGDNFSGGVYYGYPLFDTPDTRTGNGRVNVNLMYRW
ncbi:ShlB/FhaC/HecB family hemolysin secretion/activation protein [Planctomycetota bacterium]